MKHAFVWILVTLSAYAETDWDKKTWDLSIQDMDGTTIDRNWFARQLPKPTVSDENPIEIKRVATLVYFLYFGLYDGGDSYTRLIEVAKAFSPSIYKAHSLVIVNLNNEYGEEVAVAELESHRRTTPIWLTMTLSLSLKIPEHITVPDLTDRIAYALDKDGSICNHFGVAVTSDDRFKLAIIDKQGRFLTK